MLSTTMSATLVGAQGTAIRVQAATENALPQIFITGLPNVVIKESRERIRACLIQHGFDVPSRRIVVNLSPACTPKNGSQFDLAIALCCLGAEQKVSQEKIAKIGVLGELSLDGRLQPIPHALPLAEALEKDPQIESLILPQDNASEVAFSHFKKVLFAESLQEVILFLKSEKTLSRARPFPITSKKPTNDFLFDTVLGQSRAKSAILTALAGKHHILLLGPPGVGKSMLAHSCKSLLPELDVKERLQLLRIQSLANLKQDTAFEPPFRCPHHTSSASSILGGGQGTVVPGEVSLAHGGVLFLDELPEFKKDVLEGLREPLEMKEVVIRRVGAIHPIPADFVLVAAMNPCPCGRNKYSRKPCSCSLGQKNHYLKRISGPLFDRFDMVLPMGRPVTEEKPFPLTGLAVSKKISEVRNAQENRSKKKKSAEIYQLKKEDAAWLKNQSDQYDLSYRKYKKWLHVARTLADLEEKEHLERSHLQEAENLCLPSISSLQDLESFS